MFNFKMPSLNGDIDSTNRYLFQLVQELNWVLNNNGITDKSVGTEDKSIAETINKIENSDFVVMNGKSGIWTYRKWNSGKAECWASKSYSNLSISKQYDGGYYKDILDYGKFPSGLFIEKPTIIPSVSGNGIMFVMVRDYDPTFRVIALSSITTGTNIFSCYAIGNWK